VGDCAEAVPVSIANVSSASRNLHGVRSSVIVAFAVFKKDEPS
jgi:hypothetical protein